MRHIVVLTEEKFDLFFELYWPMESSSTKLGQEEFTREVVR